MAFVEINNIENFGTSNSNTWWDISKTLLGVVLGFCFTLLYNSWDRKTKRKIIGKKFENLLLDNKNSIFNQIISINNAINELTNGSESFIELTRDSKIKIIEELDRIQLIEYIKRTENFKNKNNSEELATIRISNIFYCLDSIKSETKYIASIADERNNINKNFVKAYKNEFGILSRKMAKYIREKHEEVSKDEILNSYTQLRQKYISKKVFDKNLFLQIHKTFREELIQLFSKSANHPLAEITDEFYFNTGDIVVIYIADTQEYIQNLKLSVGQMERAYEKIYNEKITSIAPKF